MDIILLSLGFLLCIIGIIGSVLPVLPGPPISWIGLLLLFLTKTIPVNYWLLGITLLIAVLVVILDYIIPAMGTKRYGGSKAGAIGTTLGLIIGIFAPIPLGFLIGPFLGAFIGEFFFNKPNSKVALKAAWGSFLGFLASTFMKVIIALIYLGIFLYTCYQYKEALF